MVYSVSRLVSPDIGLFTHCILIDSGTIPFKMHAFHVPHFNFATVGKRAICALSVEFYVQRLGYIRSRSYSLYRCVLTQAPTNPKFCLDYRSRGNLNSHRTGILTSAQNELHTGISDPNKNKKTFSVGNLGDQNTYGKCQSRFRSEVGADLRYT